jgi:CRISPR/Cas system CMR subunit Cmr4 (Cas7 group RAMP superfamily)
MTEARHDRAIVRRIVVSGTLRLLTPAHLGNGDAEAITDMPLLLDRTTDPPRPFLAGTSIAGALRGYLLAHERGFGVAEQARRRPGSVPATAAERLFGGVKGDEYGEQSPLIVDDAFGNLHNTSFEIRDGVKINYATRTADDKKKYDLELLPAGATFDLAFELLLPADDNATQLCHDLALALGGFSSPDADTPAAITLGARRSRGFGRCRVDAWTVREYDLQTPADLLAWVALDHPAWQTQPELRSGGPEVVLPTGMTSVAGNDRRRRFVIDACFALESGILIRSPDPLTSTGDQQPDAVHLRSQRNGNAAPILPGTSLAGALRSRATRIVNTLLADQPEAEQRAAAFIDGMFGLDMHRERENGEPPKPTASRLVVEERVLEKGDWLAQNRVSIDRFTGGAYDTALFAEAPYVRGEVALKLTLQQPYLDGGADGEAQRQQAQAGLLLLLLKDLWTGDLPLGGTVSIGRGRLRGLAATVQSETGDYWQLTSPADNPTAVTVTTKSPRSLDEYMDALKKELQL